MAENNYQSSSHYEDLPKASPVFPLRPDEEEEEETGAPIVSAVPIATQDATETRRAYKHHPRYEEEAPLVPLPPTDEHYRRVNDGPRLVAESAGREAAHRERQTVMKENAYKVHPYNNQLDMNLDRGNQAGQYENRREQWGINAAIATPPLEPKKEEKEKPTESGYFQKPTGGYDVKEYDIKEYDTRPYEVSEYKSVYDP